MLEWVLDVADRVEAEARLDPDYLEWAGVQVKLADRYEDLLTRLSPSDRELLLSYTEAREGMPTPTRSDECLTEIEEASNTNS